MVALRRSSIERNSVDLVRKSIDRKPLTNVRFALCSAISLDIVEEKWCSAISLISLKRNGVSQYPAYFSSILPEAAERDRRLDRGGVKDELDWPSFSFENSRPSFSFLKILGHLFLLKILGIFFFFEEKK